MSYARSEDGTRLYYEEAGSGSPIVFVHEFGGTYRSWEPQMRAFSRRHRCITFAARGYPPSDVPENADRYSQALAVADIVAVMDAAGVERAHVVGLSMGGFATLHFGLAYPARALSLLVAGCGYGAEPSRREQFRDESNAMAAQIEAQGMREVAARYAMGPTRVQFRNKNPRGWSEFAEQLAGHSAIGSALTMRGVQARRPSLWDLIEDMRALRVPTLVVAGDEDDPCLEPALLMKRSIPSAGLALMPCSGHTINLEAPDEFNRILGGFLAAVDAGAWPVNPP